MHMEREEGKVASVSGRDNRMCKSREQPPPLKGLKGTSVVEGEEGGDGQ